ncbi:MAG TPA: PQ-loop domain-containing transporter [Acidothermaceae bacterium]|jgi:uncharacterized protein with PQ loop repeat
MTGHEIAFGLGYLGAALGVAMVVPQIVRIVRHPSLPGVSPISWALTVFACLLWMTYGLRSGALPQIPGNVLLVCGAIAVVLLVKTRTSRARRAVLLTLGAGLLEATAWVIPPQGVGYLAFAIGTVSTWPQLYDSVGNWRAHLNSGVSLSTWGLRIASQVCWLSYAVGTSDLPVGIGACVAGLTGIAMVALETAARAPAFGSGGVMTETA